MSHLNEVFNSEVHSLVLTTVNPWNHFDFVLKDKESIGKKPMAQKCKLSYRCLDHTL